MTANHFILHLDDTRPDLDASKATGTDASPSGPAFTGLPPLPVCIANSAADISGVVLIILFAKKAMEQIAAEEPQVPLWGCVGISFGRGHWLSSRFPRRPSSACHYVSIK